jgi:SAM-dependent methyltransferase
MSNTPSSTNQLKEYESESVQKTLDNTYVPKPILEARTLQDEWLIERFKGQKIRIADIGCGDGYHGEIFAPDCIAYDGYEISEAMTQKTNDRWTAHGLKNARVSQCDAGSVPLKPNHYDVAWSLYFTSGNFRDELKLEEYTDAYLDRNPKFIKIISNFFKALKPGGHLLLTVYKDKPETEEAQRTFYQKTGQTLVTPLGSRFVSTQENFWSVRWTKESMLSNLEACGIKPDQVTFHDLNAVSWIVEITK